MGKSYWVRVGEHLAASKQEAEALKRERITTATVAASLRKAEEQGRRLTDELERALWDNKILHEQVLHLQRENREKQDQLRNMSQRLVQCKWSLSQLTLRR